MSTTYYAGFDVAEPSTKQKDPALSAEARELNSLLMEVRFGDEVTAELLLQLTELMAESGFDVSFPSADARLKPGPTNIRPASELVESPEKRGEERLVSWTKDGTLVDGSKIENAWNLKRQSIDHARKQGKLFSVWVGGQHWYPSEILNFTRKDFASLNEALGDIERTSKLLFLMRKHGALGGLTAADAVSVGKLPQVLRLAADWANN